VTPEAARRAGDTGIAVVTQPAFVALPTFHEMPIPHGLRLLGHRTLLDAGVRGAPDDGRMTWSDNYLDRRRLAKVAVKP
jgi:hypothetical protein